MKKDTVVSVLATVVLVGVVSGVVYTTQQELKNRPPEVTITNVKVIRQTEEQRQQRYKEMFADYETLNPIIIRELGDGGATIDIGHSYLKNTINVRGLEIERYGCMPSDAKAVHVDLNNLDIEMGISIQTNIFDPEKFCSDPSKNTESKKMTLRDGSVVTKYATSFGKLVEYSGYLDNQGLSFRDEVNKNVGSHNLNLTGNVDSLMTILKDEIMNAKQDEITIGMSCNPFEMKEILNGYLCLYSDPTHKLDAVKLSKYDENNYSRIRKYKKDGQEISVFTGWCEMKVNVQKMKELITESEKNEEKLKVIAELWSASLNKDLEGRALAEELQKNIWRLGNIVEAIGDRKSWDEDKNAPRKIEGALGRVRDTTSPTRYMTDGLGVCVAKAELMEWVLDYMNIHSVTVSGECIEPHMWIALGVGNQWFHYDINTDYYSKDYKTGERIYMGTSDITEIKNIYDMADVEFKLHDMSEYGRINYAAFDEVN